MRPFAPRSPILETPALAAALLLFPAGLAADTPTGAAASSAGEPPAPASLGVPEKALSREELALLHRTSVKAPEGIPTVTPTILPATAPTILPATAPTILPGESGARGERFSLGDAPDLRSIHPRPPPWVHADEIELPELYEERTVEQRPLELSPWTLFADKLDFRRAVDSYHLEVGHDAAALFYLPPPRETAVARKLRKMATDRMFKEIRRHVRRYWKDQFKEHPSIDYSEYESRLVQINNIGKDPSERDYWNVEYNTNEFKQGLLRKERDDVESDLPLLTWGPVTVTDSGSVRFDVGTAADAGEYATIDVGEERRKPILASKSYEVDTSVITDVNPFRGYTRGNALSIVRRLGFEVKVDWLTDVLARKVVSAELECTADLEGEWGAFVNFVIHSR